VNVVLPLIATVEAGWLVTWKFAVGETVTVDRLSGPVPVFATVKVTSLGAVPKSTAVLWPLVKSPPLQLHAMLGVDWLVTGMVKLGALGASLATVTVAKWLPRFASKARTVNVVLPLIATVEAGWLVTWKFAVGETVTVDRLSAAVPVFATVNVTSLGAVPKSTAVLWPLVKSPPLQLHAMLGVD
jgi:hypothetical protein